MTTKQLDLLGKALEVSEKMSKESNSKKFEWDTQFYPMEEEERIVGTFMGVEEAYKGKFKEDYFIVKTKDGTLINLFGFASLKTQIRTLNPTANKDVILIDYLGIIEWESKNIRSYVVGLFNAQKGYFVSSKGKKLE